MQRNFPLHEKSRLLWVIVLLSALALLYLPRNAQADDDEHGFLGVYLGDKSELCTGGEEETSSDVGAYVRGVVEDGPAEEAGLEKGDIIVRFNGKAVEDGSDLRRLIRKTRPGDEVEVVVRRDGEEKTFTVKMGEPDEEMESWSMWRKYMPFIAPYMAKKRILITDEDRPWMGIEMQRLTDQLRDYFKVKDGGVLISSVTEDSPAEKAGLRAGDVIIKMDDEEVENRRDVIEILEDKEIGDKVAVTVIRDGKRKKMTVTLAENPDKGKGHCWSFGGDDEDLEMCPPGDYEGFPPFPPIPDFDREAFMKEFHLKIDVEDLQEELNQLKEELEVLKEKVEKKK